MVFHRRLGQIEHPADRLVVLALHHEREHFDLTSGQAKIGWRGRLPPLAGARAARAARARESRAECRCRRKTPAAARRA